MGSFLTREQLDRLVAADVAGLEFPVPTRMISNGEFQPEPQTPEQRRVEARLLDLADGLARRRGMDRRSFLRTAGGMAAAFLAMNEIHGEVFRVAAAEAAEPEAAAERARALADQFIFDSQLHFVRADAAEGTNPARMVGLRQFAAMMLNPDLRAKPPELSDIQFRNFFKEVYLDSDTSVGILSGAPGDDETNWFLSNEQMARARKVVNDAAGSKRLYSHAVITPGQPGWLDEMDRAIEELKPDSWKGYTMGDPNGPSVYRWRLDDEDLVYPAFEKMVKAGITTVCLHKGLLPPNAEQRLPGVTAHAGVDDVGKAAKDWPQLTFVIYHAGYNVLMPTEAQGRSLEETGEVPWVSDLARIPEEYGVSNVLAEVGSSFGIAATTQPRFCAAMMGLLVKGMGEDNVFWGTDSVWYGSPQWQIEAFRRLEIPEDLREKFGFAPLGGDDSPVKRKILGLNAARLYGLDVDEARKTFAGDELARLRAEYQEAGPERSNLAYGFVDVDI